MERRGLRDLRALTLADFGASDVQSTPGSAIGPTNLGFVRTRSVTAGRRDSGPRRTRAVPTRRSTPAAQASATASCSPRPGRCPPPMVAGGGWCRSSSRPGGSKCRCRPTGRQRRPRAQGEPGPFSHATGRPIVALTSRLGCFAAFRGLLTPLWVLLDRTQGGVPARRVGLRRPREARPPARAPLLP